MKIIGTKSFVEKTAKLTESNREQLKLLFRQLDKMDISKAAGFLGGKAVSGEKTIQIYRLGKIHLFYFFVNNNGKEDTIAFLDSVYDTSVEC